VSDHPDVVYETEGSVAFLTLNRPDRRNALTPTMMDDLETAVETADLDEGIRVLVIKADGPAFSSGYDMGGVPVPPPDADGNPVPFDTSARAFLHRKLYAVRRNGNWWLKLLWDMRKPTIAQVSGYCLAGGNDLALCCDLVYAAEDAKFGMPQGRALGVTHTHALLPLLIGMRKAKELSFTGDSISGVEAERMGLINRAFAPEKLDAEVRRVAERVALTPGEMLMSSKWSINRVYETMGLDAMIRNSNEWDAIGGFNPRSEEFYRVAATQGMKAAIAFRDGPYEEGVQR
jgi:enoyl-CoA hydratase